MREIIRLFAQIALLRRGPQDLPASPLLLTLTLTAYLAVSFLLSAVLPPMEGWRGPLVVDALFTLAWYAVLLRAVGRPERILQTATAVFGLQAVLAPLSIPSDWLARRFAADATWQVPVTCAALALLAWLVAANGRIVKAALEWSGSASVALVILQMLTGWLLLLALFPATST